MCQVKILHEYLLKNTEIYPDKFYYQSHDPHLCNFTQMTLHVTVALEQLRRWGSWDWQILKLGL